MKTTNIDMKKTLLKCLILTMMAAFVTSESAARSRKAPDGQQLAAMRALVWADWRKEWRSQDASLAPWSFLPLDSAVHACWTLPDSLEASAEMDYYSGVKGERPSEGYPFFLYLHGSGPRDQEWATGLVLAKRFDDAPSMYMVPRIPNEGEYYRWWHRSKQWAWDFLLRRALAHPDIDPSRIYWFGISEGGYGSQRLASFYADYLAAVGPMAGGEPLRNAPAENLCHTPYSMLTGEKDLMFYRNILTRRTKERLDSLKSLYPDEYTHRVILEEGRGHHVTYDLTTPWLKQYRREAQPSHFRWENYEMHGRKRNSFYNLEVLAESSDERHDYEFTVKDNVVRLDVGEVQYVITETDPQWGIELNNTRRYTLAQSGSVRVYLSEKLVDLSRPVVVMVNGRKVGKYRLSASAQTMMQACRLWGDPLRVFPCVIDVHW